MCDSHVKSTKTQFQFLLTNQITIIIINIKIDLRGLSMIVCICNNVNTDAIHSSIDAGACSVEGIREDTGAASCCGKCQFKVNRILQDRQSEALQTDCLAEAVYP